MKLHCQIEPSDYIKAQYLHIRPRPLLKWAGICFLVLLSFVGIQVIFGSLHEHIPIQAFIPLGALAYLALLFGVLLPLKSKKIYRQQKSLQEPYEAEITSEDFTSTNSRGTAKIRWTDFHKYKIGKDMILVYQSDVIFHMFPKRWFSDDDFQELIGILKNALGKPKP